MSNLYHILFKSPATLKTELDVERENLAQALVVSGKLRIDARDKINFVRFARPYNNINLMFSLRELTDDKLLPDTKKILAWALQRDHRRPNLQTAIEQEIKRLINEISKNQPVSEDLELKLARVIVQAAHPIVIKLLLLEQVQIFISYSYNIGDLMDIQSWQHSGKNSGMQSTDGRECAIFVSAGGDPFASTEKDAIYGDGFPALARMTVIAAQEIGHYSDIMRDIKGRQISRHSANFGGRRAKENVRQARLADLEQINKLCQHLKNNKLFELAELERHLKFYKNNKRRGWIVAWTQLKILWCRRFIIHSLHHPLTKPLISLVNEKYLASKIIALIDDMKFNLAPIADVYKSEDKLEEEAIACIEALARVPQQAFKWGHKLTNLMMPHLYTIYYQQVIPACITAYENMTNSKYSFKKINPKQSLWYKFKKLFRKKEKTYAAWEY
jgi:hypothetical protein